jgi:hypothetical protein
MPSPGYGTLQAQQLQDLWKELICALLSTTYPDGTAYTLPTSATFSGAVDVSDRSGRLLGHVTVDNASLAVTGTFWQATQPVSLATNTPDVTDRAARLLGHVTVDNASIPVTGTFWQATQPVSGTVTANAGSGTFATQAVRSSTSASGNVAASVSTVTIIPSNASRLGATVYNDSTAICYLMLGAFASTTNFAVQMLPNSYYEVPFGWTGVLTAVWASATGNARWVELT